MTRTRKLTGQDGALERVYFNERDPAGYSTPERLYKGVKKTIHRGRIADFLEGERAYTLHKNVRKNFPRNKTFADTIDACWQCDLMDCSAIAQYNNGMRFILLVVDVFSRFAWTVPLQNKTALTVLSGFRQLFKTTDRRCAVLISDKGREINNNVVNKFLKDHGIEYFHTQNPQTKCTIAERLIRTLRLWMQRYFTKHGTHNYTDGLLENMTHAYNNKYHRTIKMTPSEASDENNIKVVYNNLYSGLRQRIVKSQLRVGDHVRISREKHIFEKGSTYNWTEEIFKIVKVIPHPVPVYKISDLDRNEMITGHFYSHELNKVKKPTVFQIDHIVETKGKGARKKLLVHWTGYPVASRSWIFAKDLV